MLLTSPTPVLRVLANRSRNYIITSITQAPLSLQRPAKHPGNPWRHAAGLGRQVRWLAFFWYWTIKSRKFNAAWTSFTCFVTEPFWSHCIYWGSWTWCINSHGFFIIIRISWIYVLKSLRGAMEDNKWVKWEHGMMEENEFFNKCRPNLRSGSTALQSKSS